MKRYGLILCLFAALPLAAANLPDNVYFRAMQDEMTRTKKQLHVKGSAKPFYIVYRIARQDGQTFAADMGQLYAQTEKDPFGGVGMAVYMYAGDRTHNSSGFVDDYYAYTVLGGSGGDSYEALRHNLWQLTDWEYIKASNVAAKKEAYKRRKNLQQEPADFSSAPHASFVEEIVPYVLQDSARYNVWVKELSARGKDLPYLEKYAVTLHVGQVERYFLDSEGNFYQLLQPDNELALTAAFRNKDGYKQAVTATYSLPVDPAQTEHFLNEKSAEFLQQIKQQYQAIKAEPYIGPVLFTPEAAAGFFDQLFVKNIRNTKPLLSASKETDVSAGLFKDKLGMRVLSPIFDVYDRPLQREYNGMRLAGFMPVDGEGVAAQTLQLVKGGKLNELPTTRSLIKGQKHSNGHARSSRQYPRADITNVFFEPSSAVPAAELEEKLLQRCRELGLEYGYIFHSFPYLVAERIYVKDGRKEPVYGLKLDGLTARSLRDIWAAGDDSAVESFGNKSLVTPSILVDEIELVPSQQKPDRAPFVALPK